MCCSSYSSESVSGVFFGAMSRVIWVVAVYLFLPLIVAKKTYIVQTEHSSKPALFKTHRDWYSAHLVSVSSSSASLLYTYSTAYHGFAAALEPGEAEALRQTRSVLGVYEDTVYALHTTRTPQFLGLDTNFGFSEGHHDNGEFDRYYDVIIGVLDTGVWPESKSFDDSGIEDIPVRWRGKCELAPDFNRSLCNKKLIGARSFSKGYRIASGEGFTKKQGEKYSARDRNGHGTHTASTAAGSLVTNASLRGYARGTARGMATMARLSVYKVCWPAGCFGSDILAGMERAIIDGVDILSLSLGGGSAPYYQDTIAIGAFSAMERGIFVSCSAGNSGPSKASLANVAPWIMTVGAGTLDRDFPAYIRLGNDLLFTGVSLYSGKGMGTEPVELFYGSRYNNGSSNMCLPGSLEPEKIRGKLVVCDRGINARVEKGRVVRDAGGVGMILANTALNGEELPADSHLLPAVSVGRKVGNRIRKYAKSDLKPTAILSFGGTVLNVRPSPVVAEFSSRGPNTVTPQILKPDVIGPGVNIIAAWSEAIGPSGLAGDLRKTLFNIMSGTSMSCPHISGLAALLKGAHPDWSPSAIKSALMTTAYNRDNSGHHLRDAAAGASHSTPFAHGSGHVDPHKAISPGLVYDISPRDYIVFLCSLNYSSDQLRAIVKRSNVSCSRKFSDPGQLNYPSFSVVFGEKRVFRYTRVVKNVGEARAVYEVAVKAPATVNITVKPAKLAFTKMGEKKRYTVTFSAATDSNGGERFHYGSIEWSNRQHKVRSPIAFSWKRH